MPTLKLTHCGLNSLYCTGYITFSGLLPHLFILHCILISSEDFSNILLLPGESLVLPEPKTEDTFSEKLSQYTT